MTNPICDYENCNESVCDEDMKLQTGMRFCKKHSDELEAIIVASDTKGILRFWIVAQGGSNMAAKEEGKYNTRRLRK